MVNKALANKTHPYRKFGTGNKQTLQRHDLDIRKELIEFHKTYYKSGNLMNLAVLGKGTLDDLEKIVRAFFTDGIEFGKTQVATYSDQVFASEEMMTKTFITPVQDVRSMTLSFQTPCLKNYYKSKVQYLVLYLT
jgi:insulysin